MSQPQSVLFTLKSTHNQLRRLMSGRQAEHRFEMTGMQHAVIGYLGDHAGARDIFQRDLERHFDIRRSTATGILQLMERGGLIRREPVSHDARLKKLLLTEKALKLRHQAIADLTALEARIIRDIPREELEAFFRVMGKIAHNIRELEPGEDDTSAVCKRKSQTISEENHS